VTNAGKGLDEKGDGEGKAGWRAYGQGPRREGREGRVMREQSGDFSHI